MSLAHIATNFAGEHSESGRNPIALNNSDLHTRCFSLVLTKIRLFIRTCCFVTTCQRSSRQCRAVLNTFMPNELIDHYHLKEFVSIQGCLFYFNGPCFEMSEGHIPFGVRQGFIPLTSMLEV